MEGGLTVGFLEACTSPRAAELLGLASTRVGDEQGAIVGHEDVLDFFLGRLVYVLLVVGDEGLGDGLPNGIDLCDMTAALDSHTNVHSSKSLLAQQQHWLLDLESEQLGLDLLEGASVDLDEAIAALAVRDCSGSFLAPVHLD